MGTFHPVKPQTDDENDFTDGKVVSMPRMSCDTPLFCASTIATDRFISVQMEREMDLPVIALYSATVYGCNFSTPSYC